MDVRVAVVGVGAMGEAIVRGLLGSTWHASAVSGLARRPEQATEIRDRLGIVASTEPADVIPDRDVIVVAVKPKDVPRVLERIAPHLASDSIVLSVAAGVTIETLEMSLPGTAVVRAMPNTPSIVGEGVTGVALGEHVTEVGRGHAIAVLEAVGDVSVLDESVLDAVTAVSGTGPAYVFLLAEALIEAGIREGMSRRVAELFVHQTIRGAGHLLTETGIGAPGLRSQVTSPGGTTAAAVHVLEERGFRALVEDAVRAAAKRSRELGSGSVICRAGEGSGTGRACRLSP